MPGKPSLQTLAPENLDLRARLEKAEESLRAITSGEADALFIAGADGAQLFSLKDANESYRALIENMNEGALTLTPAGLILYSNRRFAEMLGAPLEKVIGSAASAWFPPEKRQALQALLHRCTEGDTREESVLNGSGGTPVPVYLSVSCLVLNANDSISMIVTDLTEQKQNAALLAAEKLPNAILEQAGDAIIICDKAGRITRASEQAQMMCGKSPLGLAFDKAFPLRRLDGSAFSMLHTITMNRQPMKELILECGGHKLQLLMSIGHLKDVQNELLGSVVTLTDITRIKAAEFALQESKTQLSEALEIAKIGYWEFEFATNEFIFNDQYYSLHKITAADAGGYRMSAADFTARYVYPEDAPTVGRNIQMATEARDPDYVAKVEARILTGKGEIVWVEVRFHTQKDGQGKAIGLIGVNQDITDRKIREQELFASKKQLQATLDAIPDLLFETELDGRIIAYHSPRTELLTAPPEDLLEKKMAEILPAAAAEIVLAALREAEATGRSSGKQYDLALPQGWRCFELSISRMAAAAGEKAHFICLSRDITKRKRAEQELRESELAALASRTETAAIRDIAARLQAILDTVWDGVITIDESGSVETFNLSAQRIFGYAAGEVVGRNISILMPDPYDSQHDKHLERYASTGEAHIIGIVQEVKGRRKDGSTFLIELMVSEMVLDGKRHFTGMVRDITERKAAELAVIEARTEAERANAAKSIFLANMSHEIRTPMNGVIGMIEVLQQSNLSGSQMEMTEIIRDSSLALLDVINDILDFSKIEAGKLEIDPVPMSVADVVEKTCEIMDRMAQKNGVELTSFIDPAIPGQLMGDPGRLRQILINLTNNAIKFSSKEKRTGRVSIRVVVAVTAPGQVALEFKVSDNGIGIDEATRARLFSPFVQADASTTRMYGGTGLGLAISRQLASMMDGSIDVQSEPGKGTIFNVHIPFAVLTGKCTSDPVLVAGLACLVVAGPDGMARDLAAYLEYDHAEVELTPDAMHAREWIVQHPSGRAVIIIDTTVARPLLEELVASAQALPHNDIHFVVLGHGSRRKPRPEGDRRVSVDGNILTRRALLKAVAMAAGRIEAKEPEALSTQGQVPISQLSSTTVQRHAGLILVAEDNLINRNVILHQLNLLGYNADLAVDGREALIRWRQGGYSLLLTDLQMPLMDGYELAAAIRNAEGIEKRLPIVALTANALKSEKRKCMTVGMNDYLTKPVLLEQLKAMLEKWLPILGQGETSADTMAVEPEGKHLAVLDRTVLPGQIGDDPALIAKFLKDFQSSAHKAVSEIRTALANSDWKGVGESSHKLKSSSRSVGALALGEVCHRLEQAGKDGNAAPELAAELENALATVINAMNQ